MLLKRRSAVSGEVHERDIDVTHEQIQAWEEGRLIQDVMPHLSADDQEFIKTGITPEEWDYYFGEPEYA